MGLAHEKKSYLQEKANLFEIGSRNQKYKPEDGLRNTGGHHGKRLGRQNPVEIQFHSN